MSFLLILIENQGLKSFKNAHSDPDPDNPNGFQGLEQAPNGIFALQVHYFVKFCPVGSLNGLRDLLVGQDLGC